MNYLVTGWNVAKGSKQIYKLVKKYKKINRSKYMDLTTRKERSDMILEPLQVMVQLALLSQSPIGTKVSVSDNILQLHPPSWTQELGDGGIRMGKMIYTICFTLFVAIINGIRAKIIESIIIF